MIAPDKFGPMRSAVAFRDLQLIVSLQCSQWHASPAKMITDPPPPPPPTNSGAYVLSFARYRQLIVEQQRGMPVCARRPSLCLPLNQEVQETARPACNVAGEKAHPVRVWGAEGASRDSQDPTTHTIPPESCLHRDAFTYHFGANSSITCGDDELSFNQSRHNERSEAARITETPRHE